MCDDDGMSCVIELCLSGDLTLSVICLFFGFFSV